MVYLCFLQLLFSVLFINTYLQYQHIFVLLLKFFPYALCSRSAVSIRAVGVGRHRGLVGARFSTGVAKCTTWRKKASSNWERVGNIRSLGSQEGNKKMLEKLAEG